jgi:hypothetical protein
LTGAAGRRTIIGALLPGPLHRVTRLRRDPAYGWLTYWGRWAVSLKGMIAFILALVVIRVSWNLAYWLSGSRGICYFVATGTAATIAAPTWYFHHWLEAITTSKKARENSMDAARPIDDVRELEAEPDGSIVSVVGWVRGHGYLLHRPGGHQAVGLAMHCRGQNLVETLHNLDILDEEGNSALVLAGGARLMGRANVNLSRAEEEDRNTVHALNLPAGVAPSYWTAYIVRDGDPVMVIGTKTTVHDMSQAQLGRPVMRAAIATEGKRPLLVFPIDAERMDVS